MQKFKISILIFIWSVPVALLCYFLFSFNEYETLDLSNGSYVIKNGKLLWAHQISNGVFKSSKLINTRFGEELFLTGEDFAVQLGFKKDVGWIDRNGNRVHSTYSSQIINPENCKLMEHAKTKCKTSLLFYYEPLKVFLQLNYTCDSKGPFFHRNISLTSQNEEELIVETVKLGNWSISESMSGGGKGLPIFINEKWFFSGEEPWVEATVNSNSFLLTHRPSACLKKDETWNSDSTIIGGGNNNAKQILKDYIDSIILSPRFFTQYNTWYDLREDDLSVSNITNNFIQLTNKLNYYGANVDYCVVDDGWFLKDTLYGTKTNTFPNGLKELSDDIAPYKSKLGLWLPFSSLYLDNEALKKYGFEEANSKYFCLSGTNYFNALSDRIAELINNSYVKFFKHDFNYFDCIKPGHNHLRNLIHGREANMRKTAQLLDFERKINPDVVQAITTGINLSPWWLKYAHILYMGGKDMDFDTMHPATSRAMTEMNYRDGMLYEILREKGTFFPLYALMTHGIIDGKLNSVGPWLNEEQWMDYVMNYLGRGTAIRELYLYPPKLNKTKSEMLGRGLAWANKHNDQMLYSEMILGDPRENEVYAFRGHDKKGNCYVSIRNPRFTEEEVSIDDLGINSKYVRIVYPYNKVCNSKVLSKIKIPAESVIVLESVNNGIWGNLFGKFNETEETVLSMDQKIKIEQFNIKDNEASLNVEIPDNASANLIISVDNDETKITIKDNRIPVTQTRKTTFPNAAWKVEIVPLNNGSHKINISSNKPLEKMLKLQLRARYLNTQTPNVLNETINIY